MERHEKNDQVARFARELLTDAVLSLLRSGDSAAADPDGLYEMGISSVVNSLFRARGIPFSTEPGPCPLAKDLEIPPELGVLTPGSVGKIYEYLRGFKLELQRTGGIELVPSIRGKRNEGLFYTPARVVRHIVSRTLDALDVSHPSEYLRARILDPAMGTGIFLAEVLGQITARIIAETRGNLGPALNAIMARASDPARMLLGDREPDLETALRVHILENCLYGVDLDPIAVQIGKAVLLDMALGTFRPSRDIRTRLRVGNALVGTARADPCRSTKETEDQRHSAVFFGKALEDGNEAACWAASRRVYHWPLEFPEIFRPCPGGFDAVVGNPPYEIVSVKESGKTERLQEQAYFRRMYRTCQGKINTYRLMIERALELLKDRGALGFIVPATLLADSTASKLRGALLEGTEVLDVAVIPEKARVFPGVTQALLILIARKGPRTSSLKPSLWTGQGPIPSRGPVEISAKLIRSCGSRIPILRDEQEKKLLEALARFPPLSGNGDVAAAGRVHQGEINLTIHREFLTAQPTGFPLIRGEHVAPFRVNHPSPSGRRLDWILPNFPASRREPTDSSAQKSDAVSKSLFGSGAKWGLWRTQRIVLARVVNMGTKRRLKAAVTRPGSFLGDMTNFVADTTLPHNYLLGLLNSRLLNWRIRVTSTNNYLSAEEVGSLPIPRISESTIEPRTTRLVHEKLTDLIEGGAISMSECLARISSSALSAIDIRASVVLPVMIDHVVRMLAARPCEGDGAAEANLMNVLDALVLILYGAGSHATVLER